MKFIIIFTLYEILRRTGSYFKLRCGQSRIRIRSARGGAITLHFIGWNSNFFNFRYGRQICQVCFICVVILTTGPVSALDNGLPTAGEIIEKANHVALYQGLGMKGRVHLKIIDKQGRVRKRVLNILRKDEAGKKDGDQKYFTYFKIPADVRKMVFMVHKHIDPKTDDDRWLYLPAMDLVKRIAASDKRTSFVGSDFLYEDISGRNPSEDIHTLIQTTKHYYIIDNRPKNPNSVEFEYYLAYIHRQTFITDKLEFYKKGGGIYRTMEVLKVKEIHSEENGVPVTYPTVVSSQARNLETGSVTQMTLTNIVYNPDLGDEIFSERYLRRPPRDITR